MASDDELDPAIARLFPRGTSANDLPDLLRAGLDAMPQTDGIVARVPGWAGAAGYSRLEAAWSRLPDATTRSPRELVEAMARELFSGTVDWRSPMLQYNLGAPANVVAAALYALALDLNVYLINDGLAGNAIVAERAVSRILAELAGLEAASAYGTFTFGGTGTILYAFRAGIAKARRAIGERLGVYKVVLTEDAHFSHATVAQWLGIEPDDIVTLAAGAERRSTAADAERRIRAALDAGFAVPLIVVNGGTTYDHAVDPVEELVRLRDRLAAEYRLPYAPHLHVDSVVGWAWLMFRDYDFESDPDGLAACDGGALRRQYERIAQLRYADSWGVDFHKGAGCCPIDCSFVMFNDRTDLAAIGKDAARKTMHQLASDFSTVSPVDYTLETSRAGGKALAALASLHSLGRDGYRRVLARLVTCSQHLRAAIAREPEMATINPHALGYQTMIRLYPPETDAERTAERELTSADAETAHRVRDGNDYLKAFFTWDNATRMDPGAGGPVYSFSRTYVRTPSGENVSGLKVYFTSPYMTPAAADELVATLRERKREFDRAR
jgi:L-2,4-diaminobutyrate decarboxylase